MLKAPFAYSRAWYAKRYALVVEILTEEGLTGFREVYCPAKINRAVVDENALKTEAIWAELYSCSRDHGHKGFAVQALSGIDLALWDLKGGYFSQPIHVSMGGPFRNYVEAYAIGLYRRDRNDHADYLREEAAGYVAEGFGAVKLKIGFGVEHDVAITRAVRAEIGREIDLMVDANHAYDVPHALEYGRKVAYLNLAWFEEPVVPEYIDGYVEIKREISMPISSHNTIE